MEGALFVVDLFEQFVGMVIYCSYPIKLCFCCRRGQFVVVIKVYNAYIEAIEASVEREFVCGASSSIVGKSSER